MENSIEILVEHFLKWKFSSVDPLAPYLYRVFLIVHISYDFVGKCFNFRNFVLHVFHLKVVLGAAVS